MSQGEKTRNIGGVRSDTFWRYKTYELVLKIEGRGIGIHTVITNLYDIADDLNRPPAYLMKAFGFGLNTNHELLPPRRAATFNGKHTFQVCDRILDKFIGKHCLCRKCGNPETTYRLSPGDSSYPITHVCAACGEDTLLPDLSPKMVRYIYQHPPEDLDAAGSRGRSAAAGGKAAVDVFAEGATSSIDDLENREITWSVDTSIEGVRSRRAKENVQRAGFKVQDINPETKKEDFIDLANMTPQVMLRHLMKKCLTHTTLKRGPNGELSDAHFYYSILQVKKRFSLDKGDLVPLICEALILDPVFVNDLCLNRSALLRHYAKTTRQKKQILLNLVKLAKNEPDLLPRVPVFLYHLFVNGVVPRKTVLEWHAGVVEKRRLLSYRKLQHACVPFVQWLHGGSEEEEGETS